jgi:vitamin B12 transporter
MLRRASSVVVHIGASHYPLPKKLFISLGIPMKKSALATAVVTLVSCVPILAQGDDTLETVLVHAARQPINASASGSAVTVLDRELLQQRQSAPLAEILRSVPGLAVSRVGVVGSQSQIRMRGGEANQVLVFIDGIRANDPAQNDEFNMAHVLNYDIDSVEVIRGPQSALWGSDALAGVINIKTRQAENGLRGDAFAEGGSNSWQNYGASGAFANSKWRANFGANSLDTDGENISREGGEDDGYNNQTLSLGLGYEFNERLRLDSNLRYTDAENDYDGTDFSTGLPADSANETDSDQLYGRVIARLDTWEGRWSHQLSYSVTDTSNENQSENEYAASGFDVTEANADVSVASYQTSFQINEQHSLTAAIERQEEDFKQRGPVDFGDPNRDEEMDIDSFIVEYRTQPIDSVSVLASARHDDNSDFDDKTTGRLSAAWSLNQGSTKLRAAYGTGVKNPTFTERFGYFNDFIGNPDLKPEESTGWEVGIDQRLLGDRLSLSLTYFHEELDDEINGFVFDPASGGFTAENENGSSDRDGVEFNGAWLLMEDLSLNFAYTWIDATEEDNFSGEKNDEIRRPEHIASANLNWAFLNKRANLNLNLNYNGEQDDFFFPPVPPYQERVELDDFTLLTVAASYLVTPKLELFARVENALDEDYEEVFGYVAPGRSAYAGVRYRFSD